MKLNQILLKGILIPFVIVAFIACKKTDDAPAPVPGGEQNPPPPPPVEKVLSVAFDNSTVSFANADSILVELKAEGKTTIKKKLTKKDAGFESELAGVEAGMYEMAFDVYTKEAQNGNRFKMSKTVQLPLAGKMEVKAPDNKLNGQWKSYWMFQEGEVRLYVPMDPTDPLFELEVKEAGWEYGFLHKILKKAQASVLEKAWECQGDCFLSGNLISNNTYFAGFAQNAATVQWDQYEVHLQLLHQQSSKDVTIYRLYNKQ